MSYFIVDVESDGPCPGLYSMISFGAIRVQEDLENAPTFYGQLRPISDKWIPEALAVSGFTREQTLEFDQPLNVMEDFTIWVINNNVNGRATFVSDNNGFDWQFINYYLHRFVQENIFGFSSRRIGDMYCGLQKDASKANEWKKFRKTKHTHNPVDDARGNAEALLAIKKMGLKIKL